MAGTDARDELMDSTPPPLAIIFPSHPDPHDAMGSTTAGLLCTSDDPRQGGRRPNGHTIAFGKIIYNYPMVPEESMGCIVASLKADSQEEPMDTTPSSIADIFR
ncbi:Fibronectin Type Iii Domain-Containing Protein 1 [Manis pentadactyla]|nr:Fibronectin Type Iii Domain-Containing Protein 1 [Manis pentadactyla]